MPVVAPFGTVTLICDTETTVIAPASVPLNCTLVALLRFVPLIVTSVDPACPLVGVNELIVGALITVNIVGLVAEPAGVVTIIELVMAVAGTVAVICESLSTLKTATVAPNFTVVAPVKFVPVITTEEPGNPIVGAMLVIFGKTLKVVVVVNEPAAFVTIIFEPLEAPAGTLTLIDVAETTVIAPALVLTPPKTNSTSVTLFRFVPLMVIVAPTAPIVGVNEVMVGGLITVNIVGLEAVPPGVVTITVPELALAGTVAEI